MVILSFAFLFLLSCKKENPCPKLSLSNSNISNQEEYLIVESVLNDYTKDVSGFIHFSQESLSWDEYLDFILEHGGYVAELFDTLSIPSEEYKILNDTSFVWGQLFSVEPDLISKEELSCYFEENFDTGWNNYHENFQDSGGYLKFGRPLIIEDKAYVEYAQFCHSLCGYGYFAVLGKENGKWVVKETIFLWIS